MKYLKLLIFLFINSVAFSQQFNIFFNVLNDSRDIEVAAIGVTLDGKAVNKTSVFQNQFSLQINGEPHQLRLTYLGFLDINFNLEVKKDTLLVCLFESKSNTLNEVQVTSNRLIDIKSLNIGVQTISIKELSKIPVLMGEIDIQRGLQTLPGVSSVGEGANGLNIRGGGADQNLLLLEGMPIYNPTHLFGLFSVIPSEAIGSIDLYKGAIPVRYGGRIASVIDLRSKEPSLNETEIKGGIGLISSKASLETPLIKNKMGLLVAARTSFTGRLLKNIESLKDFDGGFNEVFSKLLIRPNDNNKISLNYYGTADYTKFVGIALNSDGNNSEDSEVAYGVSNASFNWNHAFRSQKVYSNFFVSNAVFRPQVNSPDSVLSITVSNEIINRKASYEMILALTNEGQIEVGVESQFNLLQPGRYFQNHELIRTLPKEKSLESAFYTAWKTSIGSKFKTELGLRYSIFNNLGEATFRQYEEGSELTEETYTSTETILKNKIYNTYQGAEPRISMAYLLSENASIKANYTVSRQYIQIVANNTTPLPISRWKTSDIHIKPQISAMYSAGFYLDMPRNQSAFSAELYYRRTENFTDVKMGSDFLLKDYVETELLQGLNKAYGVETNFSKQYDKSLLNINYTYSRSYNKIEGNTLFTEINNGSWYRANIDRPHALNANIKIQQSPIHHFAFSFTFASGRPFTSPEGLVRLEGKVFPVYRSRNNQRIPAYHRLDFSWMIDNPNRNKGKFKSHWAFNVYNLYGHKNIYSVFFNNKIGSVQAYRLSVFASAIPSLSYNCVIK